MPDRPTPSGNPVDVDALEGLLRRATQGPWTFEAVGEKDNSWCLGVECEGEVVDFVAQSGDTENLADPKLICAAVNALPALISEVRAAREHMGQETPALLMSHIAKLRSIVSRMRNYTHPTTFPDSLEADILRVLEETDISEPRTEQGLSGAANVSPPPGKWTSDVSLMEAAMHGDNDAERELLDPRPANPSPAPFQFQCGACKAPMSVRVIAPSAASYEIEAEWTEVPMADGSSPPEPDRAALLAEVEVLRSTIEKWDRKFHDRRHEDLKAKIERRAERIRDDKRSQWKNLEAQKNALRTALERVADMGVDGVAEQGCPLCLTHPTHTPLSSKQIVDKVHHPDCWIAAALAVRTAQPTPQGKDK